MLDGSWLDAPPKYLRDASIAAGLG